MYVTLRNDLRAILLQMTFGYQDNVTYDKDMISLRKNVFLGNDKDHSVICHKDQNSCSIQFLHLTLYFFMRTPKFFCIFHLSKLLRFLYLDVALFPGKTPSTCNCCKNGT